jgi:hypothetical protein
VAASVIGVAVSLALDGDDGDGPATQTPAATPTASPVPRARLVSSQFIGRYEVEDDSTVDGAIDVLGLPTAREPRRTDCTMRWDQHGVIMQFVNLGGSDPCMFGQFCSASIDGRDWRTSTGLAPGDPVRRLWDLYPRAREIPDGAVIRYVLERGTAPCGEGAEGGLEAWTAGGRVGHLRVSFQAAGD